ncbi:MAG TPA: response regulator [Bacteroidetes bacterium]|nr:response regulator [Bacteroidota bacterium]
MNSKTILVIDDEAKNLEVLIGGLVNNQFQVVTATSGYGGLEKARKLNPDLILMDTELQDLSGIEFTQKLKANSQIEDIPVILLSTREGIQDRLKAYEAGVKDYIIKPLHVSEIISRIKMTLSRIEKRTFEKETKVGKVNGLLEDKPLSGLIEEFSMNHATGILTITSITSKSGQVFFCDGQVINAIVGNFRGERAVYQMIPWGRGKYTMVYQDINIKDEINISNLGLLLQAKKRLEKRAEFLKSLPSLNTVFILSSTFLKIIEKREMSGDVMRFIQLFDGQRTLQKIIDDSFHKDLVTLERVAKMYQQGFLNKVTPEAPELKSTAPGKIRVPIFTEEEFQTFRSRIIEHLDRNRNTVLILGVSASGKNEIVHLLTGPTYQVKSLKSQFPHPVDLGKVPISDEAELNIIGIPVEKNLHLFVDSLQKYMLGYIILVNAAEPETFEYLNYLIKTFRNRYQIPYSIAVSRLRDPKAVSIESLTRQLGLESYEELMPCNASDLDSIKILLLNMRFSRSSKSQIRAQHKIGQVTN